jgi:branched-chain amino acid transport system permease protein
VVIGGIGSIEGPILGVVVFFTLRQIAADWGSWYPILMGVIAIAVMLINKRGLWGAIRAWGDIAVFPVSRTLPVTPRPRNADGPR